MGYIKGSTKLLLCQVLQGKVRMARNKLGKCLIYILFKVYQCTQLITGAGLQHVRNYKYFCMLESF